MKKLLVLSLSFVFALVVRGQQLQTTPYPAGPVIQGKEITPVSKSKQSKNKEKEVIKPQAPVQQQGTQPMVNIRIPIPNFNTLVYLVRYTPILDGKTANELADFLVNQANDTTLNRQLYQAKPKQ
jgi:hypothetical protein